MKGEVDRKVFYEDFPFPNVCHAEVALFSEKGLLDCDWNCNAIFITSLFVVNLN